MCAAAGGKIFLFAPCERRWYNGQHSCLPSSWSGFDSRPTHVLVGWILKMCWKNILSMPWPGFEPGLLRPQRRVLTTRRSRLRTVVVLVAVNVVTHQSDGWWWVCLKVECALNVKQFSWCSGYHICLTHRRSPVRSRAKTCFPRGLTARISGFHPGGPGSTPGVGIFFCWCIIVECC